MKKIIFTILLTMMFGWLGATSKARDLPEQLWTDIVTEQPDGYVVDENGDVHIYTAEGLAWVSVLSNGLHGQEVDDFNGKTIYLEEDVEISIATWIPISGKSDPSPFKGTFNGNGHTIDGVRLTWCSGFNNLGFFGYLFEATLYNVVIRDGYFYYSESYYIPVGFLATQVEKSLIDRCYVECEMHGGYNVPFVYSNSGSTITNSMVHCPALENLNGNNSGAFVAENRIYNGDETLPVIQNCAAIIEKIDWSWGEMYGFVGNYNHGLIENCYAYIGEMTNFPGYSGPGGPRNGITRSNMGEVYNCYYNRIRDPYNPTGYLQVDDSPGEGGVFQDVSSFFRYDLYYNWMLTNPIHVCDPNLAWQYDLVDALNYWIDCQANGGDYRRWYVDPSGSNDKLPIFRRELPEQLWTDIVTEQPDGYVVDENGNVHIYTAEAMAWLISLTNGLNGQEINNFDGRTISLENDIDLSSARWLPIAGFPIAENQFKGVLDGKGHVIEGLLMTNAPSYYYSMGLFGEVSGGILKNIIMKDGYYENTSGGDSEGGFLAYAVRHSTVEHCFVDCELHIEQGMSPFVYLCDSSTISNCLVHSPIYHSESWSYNIPGILVAYSYPTSYICNCVSIIDRMDYSEHCGLVGLGNYGKIENCYAYIGEFIDFGGAGGGLAPRNGITACNYESGEIYNCYFNRVRNFVGSSYYIPLDYSPASENAGVIQNSVSFAEEGRGRWKLSEVLSFELENGTVTTDDLLEALNFKVELLNNPELLDWCDVAIGFDNQQLPVFCGVNIAETDEHPSITDSLMLYPNPTNGNVWVDGVEVSEIKIYNVMGQLLKSYRGIHEINVSDLPRGIYLLHITDGHGVISKKKIVVE